MERVKYKAFVDKPYGYWTLDEDDFERFKWWLTHDTVHDPEPYTPLAGCTRCYVRQNGFFRATQRASHPVSKGNASRFNADGYMALSQPIPVLPEEVDERRALFLEHIAPFKERFEDIWGDFRHKGKVGSYLRQMQENYARIGTFDLETWSFDLERFSAESEKLSSGEVLSLFVEAQEIMLKHFEIHFEIMYVTFTAYMEFEALTRELFGIDDTDPSFQKLIQGFDNKIYEFDRELWRLAHLAVDLGLADIFKEVASEQLLSRLKEAGNGGNEWLKEFRQFLTIYGRRSANPFDMYKITWIEDPMPVLVMLRDYIVEGLIDYDAERRKVIEEREKAVAELLEKVPPERKEEFETSLKIAQIAYCWNEDHNYWIEHLGFSSLRYIALEMGKRLHKAGAIADPNDIFFLNPDEIRATFLIAAEGKYDFSEFVEERKARWKAAFAKVPPEVTGEWVREEVKDPLMVKIYGLGPLVAPVEKVDLFGYPGSPGLSEGIARVITDIDELYRVEPGSILVTTATGPAWTPIFCKLKGAVTDLGGPLTHAAIVSREYRIPAVVGTTDATQRIHDGQRIRIDGGKGYVWIVEE